jgi:Ca-activated chloride channel family protein
VGKSLDDEGRKAANLIFVIDISGSMNRENRLGAVKKSLHILLDELGEGDRVGLVVYGSQGEIRLEPTDISRREVIVQAIDGLVSNGSTNVHEGLELAYGLARKYYEPGKVNRLILCSDGVANNGGSTEAEEILSLVRKASDEGVTISTIGFGMGNYNDVLMEKLADKGDGNYYYVDRQEEAERVFSENLTGMLQTIAREVKVQVAFDSRTVKRWRLLGYENRDVADRDFRNDAVDAGEVGVGHQVTALYEVKLAEPAAQEGPAIRVGTVRVRHEAPAHDTARAGQVEEIEQTILLSQFAGNFASGSVEMRAQAVAAEFAEILKGSFWAKESRLVDLIPVADGLAEELPGDPMVRDLAEMIRQAADLQESEGLQE